MKSSGVYRIGCCLVCHSDCSWAAYG